MNINPIYPNIPMTNLTPSTDSLRRENGLREVIVQPTEVQKPAAEKGAASEFDKAKTPGQNEQLNQAENQKQTDADRSTINDRNPEQQQQQQNSQSSQEESDEKKESVVNKVEQQQIAELKKRDAEVRAHEAAHANTGGVHTGAPTYSYQTGPDGKKYAVGGEVSVDLSRVSGDPRATIRKMQQVHAAALAPANPSTQDVQVAATAMRIMAEAQQELVKVTIDPEYDANEADIGEVTSGRLARADGENGPVDGTRATLKTDEEAAVEQAVFATEEAAVEQAVFATEEDRVEQAVFATEDAPVEEVVFATDNTPVEEAVLATPEQRTDETVRRSLRIQNFYMNINHTHSGNFQASV